MCSFLNLFFLLYDYLCKMKHRVTAGDKTSLLKNITYILVNALIKVLQDISIIQLSAIIVSAEILLLAPLLWIYF